MLLVILGAGASYDSVPSRPVGVSIPDADIEERLRLEHRPPLSDALFARTQIYEEVQRRYEPLREVAHRLQRRAFGESVEDVLERMQDEAARYPFRLRHLMATRYYLQELLHRCEQHWIQNRALGTNHQALYDQIEQHRGETGPHPIFVTFNYDRLIEHALLPRNVAYSSMNDYVREDRPRVIKLHGSIDWRRPFTSKPGVNFGSDSSVPRFVIERAEQKPALGEIERDNDLNRMHRMGIPLVPALALPEHGKQFECPESHIDALRAALPFVRGILAIGWRAGEGHFLRLLQEAVLREDLLVHTVCGSDDDAARTFAQLKQVERLSKATWVPYGRGFSEYVQSPLLPTLLARTVTQEG